MPFYTSTKLDMSRPSHPHTGCGSTRRQPHDARTSDAQWTVIATQGNVDPTALVEQDQDGRGFFSRARWAAEFFQAASRRVPVFGLEQAAYRANSVTYLAAQSDRPVARSTGDFEAQRQRQPREMSREVVWKEISRRA